MSNIEEEQKFEVAKGTTIVKLESEIMKLGFLLHNIQEQRDVYWDDDDCRITNLKRGLRIRYLSQKLHNVEFKSLFTKTNGDLVVEEIQLLNVTGGLDHEQLKRILVERLGYKQPFEQTDNVERALMGYELSPCIVLDKTRRIYVNADKSVELAIDRIAGLPLHLEIENTGDHRAYQETIAKLQKIFQASIELTTAGYLDLITSQNEKLLTRAEFMKKFAADNAWNVLETERELVQTLLAKAQ